MVKIRKIALNIQCSDYNSVTQILTIEYKA